MMNYEAELKQIVTSDLGMMRVLQVVKTLNLPDWWIGAGFVRNKVWDVLSGHTKEQDQTQLADIDVLYFDSANLNYEPEIKYEQRLSKLLPNIKWSVKNQARMHLHQTHQDDPYQDSFAALAHWVETATAVAVSLNEKGELLIAAPYGLTDLFELVVRPTPFMADRLHYFEERYQNKKWLEKWPKLKVTKNFDQLYNQPKYQPVRPARQK